MRRRRSHKCAARISQEPGQKYLMWLANILTIRMVEMLTGRIEKVTGAWKISTQLGPDLESRLAVQLWKRWRLRGALTHYRPGWAKPAQFSPPLAPINTNWRKWSSMTISHGGF
ncbi:unnamed protein product [Protopolystoma xenopodis]|uniref:Uncharacterized protein n=1 Tax=Protopolystoma xenopodis TaxID=117903 RepID=A0A448WGR6_9PLAT|nr:unnamed protein product [Protopolystoma xenopodis]